MHVIAATWQPAAKYIGQAWKMVEQGKSIEDALEWAVGCVEDDEEENSVGYGGGLNRNGVNELDASFMEGRERRIGAVAGLVGYRHPVSVARLVMEKTPHNLINGSGAAEFARSMGCEERDMASPHAKEEYLARHLHGVTREGHDTVGMIGLHDGHMCIAMSTSGFLYRMPGRTSDTFVPGCGYFCDDRVGAVVCTGVGEDIMRGALAAKAFFYMEQGESGPVAALRAIQDAHSRIRMGRVALVAMDKNGSFGGAANHEIFWMSYTDENGVAHKENVPYCFRGSDIPVGKELYL